MLENFKATFLVPFSKTFWQDLRKRLMKGNRGSIKRTGPPGVLFEMKIATMVAWSI